MELLRPLPPTRSYQQVLNHFQVEKALADRLKRADPQTCKRIYATMYDELFAKVPDHPRLTLRESAAELRVRIGKKLALCRRFVTPKTHFVEFGAGDCALSVALSRYAARVSAVDISDQRSADLVCPENFRLVVYDGSAISEIAAASVDTVFSDQLIEHFRPEDTLAHFELVHRLLVPGGIYVFRTPHRFTGPHDVSMYFSDEPQGFHLKEWTYEELRSALAQVGFRQFRTYYSAYKILVRLPALYYRACEALLGPLPSRLRRFMSRYFIHTICIAAVK